MGYDIFQAKWNIFGNFLSVYQKLINLLSQITQLYIPQLQIIQKILMDPPKDTYPTLHSFINHTRALLRKEQEAEMEAFQDMTSNKSAVQIQDEGVGLTNMVVLGSKDGFYGKVILTLAKYHFSDKNRVTLPEHCKLGVGDDVAIFNGKTMIAEGVVYRRTPEKIRVSLIVNPEDDNFDYLEDNRISLNIILKWNEVTYRRYFGILDTLENPRLEFPLTQLFFKQSATNYVPKKPEQFISKKLNQMQNLAISNGLVQKCHLIHGPPGTGKTTTVCELIVEAVSRGQKVLACAPSNIAVDNIVEGICNRVNCVRVGNPARVINSIIERFFDFLIQNQQGQWKSQEKKLNAAQKKVKRTKDRKQKKQLYSQMKQLRSQIQTMQQQIIQQILLDADVICCTNAGAGDKVFRKYLGKRTFDLVVIDQCGQGLEISCWIPLIKGNRVVLAGDHKQLPPTVKFQTESLLSYTLFSRAMEQLKYLGSTMLEVQYRMNKIIMGWSNKQFYNNKLVAHQSVEAHTLQQIYNGVDEEDAVILMIDTAGCQMGEQGGSMESKLNQGQADIVVSVYKKLLKYGVQAKNIAVLTPYSKQVTLIKNLMTQADVQMSEISTVDGIQGREKQCILISMVRSNPNHQIGFLKDWRRMNVAITRARRMLIVVGDSDCVTSDEKISNLVKWIGTYGSIQSAQEFRYDSNIRFGLGKISDNKPIINKDVDKNYETQKKQKKEKKKKEKKEKKESNNNQIEKKSEKFPKQLHTQEQVEGSRDQFRKKLVNLTEEHIFHNLNAYERKIVHQVAEQFGYQHTTSEDKKRISVIPQNYNKNEDREQSEEPEVQKKKKKKKNKKDKQAKNQVEKVPQNIKDLIGDQSSQDEGDVQKKKQKTVKIEIKPLEQKIDEKEEQNQPKKKAKKKKVGKQEKKQQEQEDWEKLLDDFTADMPKKDQCFKCKKKITSVTSTQCKYCNLHFCRYDLLAQQHGCEDAAREYARKGGNIDRFLEEGSKKIKQKLKQQEDKRKKKQKDNEKEKR